MKQLICDVCQKICFKTDGYIVGCEHHPVDLEAVDQYLTKHLTTINNSLPILKAVAEENKHYLAKPIERLHAELSNTLIFLRSK